MGNEDPHHCHPTKLCSQCNSQRAKVDFSKKQWKREQPVCRSCSEKNEMEQQRRQRTKTCVQCGKAGDRDQFPVKQWKKEQPSCRRCFELTKISDESSRRCHKCKRVQPRDQYDAYQWGKGGEALCDGCRAQTEREILNNLGQNESKNLADGTIVCASHSLERCDICMMDFTLPNRFTRKRAALGRELTEKENEVIQKQFFEDANINISRKICIMDGRPDCPRTGRKLRCPCNEVTYCSKECQKRHWTIHKMTCKDFLERKKKKAAKASNSKKSKQTAAIVVQPATHGLTEEQLNNIRIEAFFAENSGAKGAIEECAWQLGEHPLVIGGGSVRMTAEGQKFIKGDVAKIYMDEIGEVWDGSPRFGMSDYVQQKPYFDWIAKARQGKSQRERDVEKFLRGSV